MQQKVHPLKALNTIHKAMLIGQVLFATIALVLFYNKLEIAQLKEYDRVFQVIAIVVAALGFLLGTNLFKKQIRAARDSNLPAQQKFAVYKKASLLLWALIEAPCLLCIIFFWLTGNYAFIILAGALIFLLAIFGSSRQKVILYLAITDNEIDNLE